MRVIDHPHNSLDHALDIEVVREDTHCVTRRPQRRVGPLAVHLITPRQIVDHLLQRWRVPSCLKLSMATPGPDLHGRFEVHLQTGVGQHDRPDVPANHDDRGALRHLTLAPDQRGPDSRYLRDPGDDPLDRRVSKLSCDILSIDQQPLSATFRRRLDRHIRREPGERPVVIRRYPAAVRFESYSAVHQARVQESEAQAVGQEPSDRRLAGRDRAVDGHGAGSQITPSHPFKDLGMKLPLTIVVMKYPLTVVPAQAGTQKGPGRTPTRRSSPHPRPGCGL